MEYSADLKTSSDSECIDDSVRILFDSSCK